MLLIKFLGNIFPFLIHFNPFLIFNFCCFIILNMLPRFSGLKSELFELVWMFRHWWFLWLFRWRQSAVWVGFLLYDLLSASYACKGCIYCFFKANFTPLAAAMRVGHYKFFVSGLPASTADCLFNGERWQFSCFLDVLVVQVAWHLEGAKPVHELFRFLSDGLSHVG